MSPGGLLSTGTGAAGFAARTDGDDDARVVLVPDDEAPGVGLDTGAEEDPEPPPQEVTAPRMRTQTATSTGRGSLSVMVIVMGTSVDGTR